MAQIQAISRYVKRLRAGCQSTIRPNGLPRIESSSKAVLARTSHVYYRSTQTHPIPKTSTWWLRRIFLTCRIFEDNGFAGRFRAVPEDLKGIDIAYLETCLCRDKMEQGYHEHRPTKQLQSNQKHYKSVIYAVPTFSNPSGNTMTLRRRQQLVRLARQHDALIITDDVYDMLRWCSEPDTTLPSLSPRLVDIDYVLDNGPDTSFGNVVSNGSFSKILGPGVRTGWAEGTSSFIDGLSKCGSSVSGGAASQLVASIISETLRDGSLQTHIASVLIPAYKERCKVMITAIKQYLIVYGASLGSFRESFDGEEGNLPPEGGFFLYVLLPSVILAEDFAHRASQDQNVLVASGESFEVHGDEESVPCCNALRLCFAWEEPELLVEGVRRPGMLLRDMLVETRRLSSIKESAFITNT